MTREQEKKKRALKTLRLKLFGCRPVAKKEKKKKKETGVSRFWQSWVRTALRSKPQLTRFFTLSYIIHRSALSLLTVKQQDHKTFPTEQYQEITIVFGESLRLLRVLFILLVFYTGVSKASVTENDRAKKNKNYVLRGARYDSMEKHDMGIQYHGYYTSDGHVLFTFIIPPTSRHVPSSCTLDSVVAGYIMLTRTDKYCVPLYI